MHQINDQQYGKFTPHERALLTMSALARGDEEEATKLWSTCPRYDYSCVDLNFTFRFESMNILGSEFFRRCVRHYNFIQRADAFIDGLMDDIEMFEEGNNENDQDTDAMSKLIEHNQEIINKTTKTRDKATGRLKALYEGFKQFCQECGLNSEDILKTLYIEECCYTIDYLLSSKIEMKEEDVKAIKDYFLELWNF